LHIYPYSPKGVCVLKPIIRSITVFTYKPREYVVNEVVEAVEHAKTLLPVVENAFRNEGYEIFTSRISLPILPIEIIKDVIENIKLDNKTLLSIGAVDIDSIDEDLILSIVERGFYVPIYGINRNPVEYAYRLSRIIHRITEYNPVYGSRISIAFHEEPLETPYFPDSTSSGLFGIGVSLLYPHVIKYYFEQTHSLANTIDKLVGEITRILNILRRIDIGELRILIDYSISPWREKSVVDLIESLGYRLLEPGFNYGVFLLNELIKSIAEKIGYGRGYNEVMLPYAEDQGLIDTGREGLLRAKHLLLYSTTCVAGPDMIVVPRDEVKLWRFILDTYSVWRIKKKPLSMRIIPVDENPGGTIDLGRFGKIPVIDY
jgi:uncharacterized protein (UPF0210 family)